MSPKRLLQVLATVDPPSKMVPKRLKFLNGKKSQNALRRTKLRRGSAHVVESHRVLLGLEEQFRRATGELRAVEVGLGVLADDERQVDVFHLFVESQ